jgi:hypothetical protein
MSASTQHTTPSGPPPRFLTALVHHAERCPECDLFLNKPLKAETSANDDRPCAFGKLLLQAVVPDPSDDVLENFIQRLEFAVNAEYPFCGRCGNLIRPLQLVNLLGTEHLDCPLTEPEDEFLRRTR